jgi:S1 RNA binding domain protein
MRIKQGDIVEGIVTGITKYGAFVNVGDIIGMIHISEVSREFVNDINEHLKLNQEIKAAVIGIGGDGRLALSIKRMPESKRVPEINRSKPADFEDMLSKFKKDSDERIAVLKLEAKRTPRINKNKK